MQVGSIVSTYRLLRAVDGSAETFVAKDLEHGCEVILKFLPSALLTQVSDDRIEATFRELPQGASAVQKLKRADGQTFFVLDSADAGSLLPEINEFATALRRCSTSDATTAAVDDQSPTRLAGEAHTAGLVDYGSATDSPGQIAPGKLLGTRYRILRSLGRGGMGDVWHAFDLKLQVEVALKSLRRERFPDEESLELLRHEVRAGREVISPNVSRIYDLIEQDGHELLSMEYVDGQTLIDFLREHGPLEVREAGRIASQFLSGLEAVHDAGLVHRDIKPENVMITRTGRVVVMDFGIAQPLAKRDSDEVAGTLPYMAPEMLRGDVHDIRADLFAAGVVLAEMIAPGGVANGAARKKVWENVREAPPRLASGPWKSVLERALAVEPFDRFATARELALLLETFTPRVVGEDDQEPYPGLESFSTEDAEFFHGREAEVEALWNKLQRSPLLAVIGASGAGKTSFLRAGLIPTQPEGWSHVYCQPGENPFMSLAKALASQFTGKRPAATDFPPFEHANVALSMLRHWRERHAEALIIVDQFEELFTICSKHIQSTFVSFLERIVMETDVRVLISMRDDFLVRCQEHTALTPVFANLTVLGPLVGNALRRALVQPALSCGYRFENEEFVEEILDTVRGERGALPLLAFAMSRLWAQRDRDTGRLTRDAFVALGGVNGALAKHAEATLEKLGAEHEESVREIFRNLMTAQGTRASLTTDELLTVFQRTNDGSLDQEPRAVLSALVDARLLTTYEEARPDGNQPQQRIEVVHESLFHSWPRLVRWRTQDAGNSQLRDQLRQAAQLWAERGRSRDVLWTGAAFRDYQAWRERYPGGLTATEEAFARAMTARAEHQRRRRQRVSAAVIVLLVAATGVFATLWNRQKLETRKAEASRLLAQGELALEDNPTLRLAYAIASLELHDDPRARRFVIETLWRGPVGFFMRPLVGGDVDFSPDGKWLTNGAVVWSLKTDETPIQLPKLTNEPGTNGGQYSYFGPNSRKLVIHWMSGDEKLRIRSMPSGELGWALDFPSSPRTAVSEDRRFLITRHRVEPQTRQVQVWSLENEAPQLVATRRIEAKKAPGAWTMNIDAVDATGTQLASARGNDIELARIRGSQVEPARVIGRHDAPIYSVAFQPNHDRVAAVDQSGAIRFWSLTPQPERPLRTMEGHAAIFGPARFDPTGSFLASAGGDNSSVQVWDVLAPEGTEPLIVRKNSGGASGVAFHPEGTWLATAIGVTQVWPMKQRYARVLRAHSTTVVGLVFASDGSWMASVGQDRIARLWNLPGDAFNKSWTISKEQWVFGLAADPRGQFIVKLGKVEEDGEGILVIPLDGGRPKVLPAPPDEVAMCGDVDPTGRFVAVGFTTQFGARGQLEVRVYDLETGEFQDLDVGEDRGVGVYDVEFQPDGTLLAADVKTLRLWSLEDGTNEVVLENVVRFDSSRDGSLLVTQAGRYSGGAVSVHNVETGESKELTSHGSCLVVAFDVSGRRVVTGGNDGILRVGPITGEEPHLLIGHEDSIWALAIHPNGEWVATAGEDGSVRMWPIPEGEPLHTLPHAQLLTKLRTLTNLRMIPNEEKPGEYKSRLDAFPGWKPVPTWMQ